MPNPRRHHRVDPLAGPRVDPAGYPGERLTFDYLLLGDWICPIRSGPTGWRVDRDGGPAHGERGSLLDDVLAGPGVVPLAARLPVVAFGSNASPAQLAAKFGGTTAGIPVTRARLHGFALGHSPHISVPGYLPWVLVDDPGSVVDCAVLWLDDGQRARLDVTEPNYDLVRVDAVRYPLVVQAMDELIDYAAYRGRWGALRWPGDDRSATATTQAAVFERLGAFGWFRDMVGAAGLRPGQRRLAADADLRDRVREQLAVRGMVVGDGWAG